MKRLVSLLILFSLLLSCAFAEGTEDGISPECYEISTRLADLTDAELEFLLKAVADEQAARSSLSAAALLSPDQGEAYGRMISFFTVWSANELDGMLDLCLPAWKDRQESPRTSLFAILANRTPMDCALEAVIAAGNDGSLEFRVRSLINRNNGTDPSVCRITIRMEKEDGQWYVNPVTITATEGWDEPIFTEIPEGITEATPEPRIDGNTVLYYVPEGGEKYHLDPECKTVHEKYTPMQGCFLYSQVGDPEYASLNPCPVCGAPQR